MAFRATLTLVCRDHQLLANLDEPLQRSNVYVELLPSLQALKVTGTSADCQLLVIDLELLDANTAILDDLKGLNNRLLLIPAGRTDVRIPLPPEATLLKQRSAPLLIDGIRTLLGIPGRIFARRPFESEVTVRTQDLTPFEAHTYDLGFGGVFIESFQSLKPGARVTLQFKESPFACEGCVAWQRLSSHRVHPRYEAGIQFLFPDRNQLTRLLTLPSP